MTTAGTATFNLELRDIIEEAFERCGAELRTGYDLKTARRSLNLMTIEWANRGINLWTIEEGSIPLVTGQAVYNLPVDTIDLLEHVIRTNAGDVATQSDITISRISVSTYAAIPNKTAQGRPIQVWVDRQSGATTPTGINYPTINIWPTPNSPGDQYTFVYWRMKRIGDAGEGGIKTQDIPFRMLPCMVAGLSYYLSMKIPGAEARTEILKLAYEEQWNLAAGEDREKASIRFVPREFFIGGGGY
jgi:hypothetical protein